MFIIVSFSDGNRIKIAPITEIVYQDYLNMSPQSSYIPQIAPSCLSVFNNSISHCVQLYTITFLCVQLPECWGLSAWDPTQPRLSFCLCICLNLSLFHSLAILVMSKSPRPCWFVRDGTILHPDDSRGWKDLSSFITQNYKLQGKFICELLFLISIFIKMRKDVYSYKQQSARTKNLKAKTTCKLLKILVLSLKKVSLYSLLFLFFHYIFYVPIYVQGGK